MIKVFDRIKELTTTDGTSSFKLEGAVFGYSSFSSYYNSGDVCYYAAVHDNSYEVGSGEYYFDGSFGWLTRNPIQSTNSNNLVSFSPGVKEVFVTYPAKYSVYTENVPESGAIAIWTGPNTLSYTSGNLSGGSDYIFPNDLIVSLTAPKTFGKYATGETIPASGKTAAEVIQMAIVEALAVTTSLSSPTTIAFNQTNINNVLNFSHTINSLGGSVSSAALEWRRNNTGSWTLLTASTVTPSSYTHSLVDTNFNSGVFNYRYIVNDTIGGSGIATTNITPAAYVAPSVSSFTAGSTARDLGDISSTFGGTITRNSPNVGLSGYYIQRSINAGAYSNLGSFVNINIASGTWPVTGSDSTGGVNSTSIAYRVQTYDIYQQPANTSSVVTINFTHRSFLGYSPNLSLSLSEILALPNSTLTNSKTRTINNVTAGVGNYTYYVYAASAGDLTSVIQDGAAPVLGAFTKLSDVTGTNSFGATVTYRVYRSNATNAFTNNTLAFS